MTSNRKDPENSRPWMVAEAGFLKRWGYFKAELNEKSIKEFKLSEAGWRGIKCYLYCGRREARRSICFYVDSWKRRQWTAGLFGEFRDVYVNRRIHPGLLRGFVEEETGTAELSESSGTSTWIVGFTSGLLRGSKEPPWDIFVDCRIHNHEPLGSVVCILLYCIKNFSIKFSFLQMFT